jgi:hypothetical protein
MDRCSKTCLLLITALLAVIALKPLGSAQSVHAAPQPVPAAHHEYTSVDWAGSAINESSSDELVKYIKKKASQGREVAAVVPLTTNGTTTQITVLFRK